MSDLSDDADGIRALTEGGARFGGLFRKSNVTKVETKGCTRCGGQPVRRPLGDTGKEFLICLACGHQTEPLKSRQALLVMWNGMN